MSLLATVFLILLAVHVAHSLAANARELPAHRSAERVLSVAVQSPLFFLSLVYAWHADAFTRQLVSPVYIGLGLLAGHLIFGFSLLATHRSLYDASSHFFDFGDIWNYTFDSPIVLTRFLGVAVVEELIWRVAAQNELIRLTGSPFAGIVVTAVLFAVVHRHFFKNTLGVSVEFMAFALLLGWLYHATNSLILVIVIHAVRDIEIAYLEYLIKVDELGSAEKARSAIERTFLRGHPEKI